MAFHNSGRIVTNGLVLALDAADRNSYVSGSTVWNDLSGNNNSGSLVNGPSFSSANQGSIVFDGTNDYVDGNIIEPTIFTLMVWFRATGVPSVNDSTGGGLIISSQQYVTNSSLGYFLCYDWSNQRIVYIQGPNVAGNYVTTNNGSVAQNTICSTTVTFDGTNRTIYLNGNVSTTQNNATGPVYPTSGNRNCQIGRWGFAGFERYFNGIVSQVQIYNRALSAQEVLQNYNAQKSRFNLT